MYITYYSVTAMIRRLSQVTEVTAVTAGYTEATSYSHAGPAFIILGDNTVVSNNTEHAHIPT